MWRFLRATNQTFTYVYLSDQLCSLKGSIQQPSQYRCFCVISSVTFTDQDFLRIFQHFHICYMPYPLYPSFFLINVWCKTQIMKLLVRKSSYFFLY